MVQRTQWWMIDATMTYRTADKDKRALSTNTIDTYLTHLDYWWTRQHHVAQGSLRRQPAIRDQRRLVMATHTSAQRQVHGITYETLTDMLRSVDKNAEQPTARMLKSAYTLAWYGMLRPTEYMLTPLHKEFEPSRHLRRGDINHPIGFLGKKSKISRQSYCR